MEKKEEVLGALADWVINVTAKKEKATSEELEALPKVAEVFFNNNTVRLTTNIGYSLKQISESNVRQKPSIHQPLSE